MRFFQGMRPEVYVHTAKLRRDKKTGVRLWGFTLVVTFDVKLAESCDVPIAKAYQYITERDSAAEEVLLTSVASSASIEFFSRVDDAENCLLLEDLEIGSMRMTREGTVVEFWFSSEHENNQRLHAFMKEYAYTRLWAKFDVRQADLQISLSAKPKK